MDRVLNEQCEIVVPKVKTCLFVTAESFFLFFFLSLFSSQTKRRLVANTDFLYTRNTHTQDSPRTSSSGITHSDKLVLFILSPR